MARVYFNMLRRVIADLGARPTASLSPTCTDASGARAELSWLSLKPQHAFPASSHCRKPCRCSACAANPALCALQGGAPGRLLCARGGTAHRRLRGFRFCAPQGRLGTRTLPHTRLGAVGGVCRGAAGECTLARQCLAALLLKIARAVRRPVLVAARHAARSARGVRAVGHRTDAGTARCALAHRTALFHIRSQHRGQVSLGRQLLCRATAQRAVGSGHGRLFGCLRCGISICRARTGLPSCRAL